MECQGFEELNCIQTMCRIKITPQKHNKYLVTKRTIKLMFITVKRIKNHSELTS